MPSKFDVHKNALENLSSMNPSQLRSVLFSFQGMDNIVNKDDRKELLLEAQIQVDRAYSQIESDKTKRQLFLIYTNETD